MSEVVSPILEWLNANPHLAGLATFTISAGESVAIIGTIVPGSIMMTAIGALAGAGIIPLWQTIIWAILGAIVGDGISYWIGYHFKHRLTQIWPFRNHPSMLRAGEVFFHKYGSMSVFIGRFVGPVRALVPLVAGMLGMKPYQFLVANVASAIGWAPIYMLPGILLGAAALELPPDIALHVIMVFFLLTLFLLLCLWFIYKSFQLIQDQTTNLKNWIWRNLKKSRYTFIITVLLKHHDEKRTHGQLRLALYLIAITLALVGLIAYTKWKGSAAIGINDVMFHLFRGIRTDNLDNIMINITLLGQKQVVLPAIFICFIAFLLWKRWWTAFHALAFGVIAAGTVFVVKHLVQSPRPWGIVENAESFSMPSGHTTLATTVYMGLAFLIAASFRPKLRWPIYFTAGFIAFLVGISRLYLGAHWFTDVLASWLLSSALIIAIIISYRHRIEKHLNPLGILLVGMASIAITFGFYHHIRFAELKANYTKLDWPSVTLAMNEWWKENNAMPAYRTSLFGFPSQPINLEWTGKLEDIKRTLAKEGWEKPPVRDWISTFHRIADVSSTEHLPMVSPQYLDKNPAIILTRTITNKKNEKGLLVIRLWDANRVIKETNTTVWVGIVNIVPRSYSWLVSKNPSTIAIDPSVVFPQRSGESAWQWKLMQLKLNTGTKKIISQEIMLVRKNNSIHKKR